MEVVGGKTSLLPAIQRLSFVQRFMGATCLRRQRRTLPILTFDWHFLQKKEALDSRASFAKQDARAGA
jgi:hypothetical protein